MEYIPKTAGEEKEMLTEIGVSSLEELLDIPASLRLGRPLNLPPPLPQPALKREMLNLSRKNAETTSTLSFLGGGSYDHYIPSTVDHVLRRSEFYTAYTPYQAEMSQGLLQTIYEYQTMTCQLTGMEVACASLYDGASALAEGALMAIRRTKRKKVLISQTVHPHYRQVVETYLSGLEGVELKEIPFHGGRVSLQALEDAMDDSVAAVLVQHPNFFGQLEEMATIAQWIHAQGGLLVMAVDPISLGVLKTPGEYQADIAVGEGQALGNATSYGGPYVGFFATRREMIRQMPGRVVGATTDAEGRPGFCLTLQTREQHIRRERATSNICTNQALNALAAAVYMATVGGPGLREVACLCLAKSHAAYEKIMEIPGVEAPFNGPFFKEFVVRLPFSVSGFLEDLSRDGLFAGIDLGAYFSELENHLLICVTEQHETKEIDRLVEKIRAAS